MNEHSFMTGKRDAILQSALELFEEYSYGRTPVPLVAKRAGVAAGTIYRYFPDKESLVNELYQHWKRQFAESIFEGLNAEGDPETVFRNCWARLCGFAVDHTDAFTFLETHHHASYLNDQSREITRDLDLAMEALILEWQTNNHVRNGDPATLLAQVFGGFIGVVKHRRANNMPITRQLDQQTADAAWSLLRAPLTNQTLKNKNPTTKESP
ncbi:MAG: TetR/AcrR family transcriptional regulator [Acidimicrobiales bacterium]